jgi:hypothetical protein
MRTRTELLAESAALSHDLLAFHARPSGKQLLDGDQLRRCDCLAFRSAPTARPRADQDHGWVAGDRADAEGACGEAGDLATGKRRGRPANVAETARRAVVLERVQAGEISNAEAATEIGIAYGTWAGWKALYAKRAGVTPAPIARASVEPSPIPTGKPATDVAGLVARVEELERFGSELRERVRALVRLVEGRIPG